MTDKQQQYEAFLPQLEGLIEGQTEETSVLANVTAALHTEFGWFWTGFYLVREKNPALEKSKSPAHSAGKSPIHTLPESQLILGPFQGTVACYTIPFGRGVCGTAWARKETVLVADVEDFPGHIACSSLSRSEIVVPLFDENKHTRAVLDIDSKEIGTFDETDKKYLESAMQLVAKVLYW
ncbi:MAG: GAF domain-containing protein [Prevotella sp.]|nr:GAF domain-containing protein [Prevotella sp.]